MSISVKILPEQLHLHAVGKGVRCTNCSWEGTDFGLVECLVNGTGEFIEACPNCLDDKDLLDLD